MRNKMVEELLAASRLRDGAGTERPTDEEGGDGPGSAVQRQIENSRRGIEQFVASHPLSCLGAAIAAGVAFGWWVKRR